MEIKKLNVQAVIKSAASAASPKTKIEESRGALPFPAVPMPSCRLWAPLDSWTLVFLEAASAASFDHGLKV